MPSQGELETRLAQLSEALVGLRYEAGEIEKRQTAAREEVMDLLRVMEILEWTDGVFKVAVVTRQNRTVKADDVLALCSPELADKLIRQSVSVFTDVRRVQ